MRVTVEIIKAMNPCKDRFDDFLHYYPDFNGTVEDFVMLENITYSDKVWVLTRMMSHKQKVQFALKCALSVLNVYEDKYTDDRPRKALEAAENWLNNPTESNRMAAYAYAAAAAYAAATAAASYAYAAAAAYAAATAAASYAYADAAAYAAATAAYAAAAYAAAEQKELNLIFAVESLEAA